MTITEFIHARIDDDEAAALRIPAGVGAGLHPFGRERILAECAVKRALVQELWETAGLSGNEFGAFRDWHELERVGEYPSGLRHLATLYSDHPDFQETWTP
ncbi:DUF6221 family protein [Ruania alba]|uniref:Uncharacterized protein n=1 Tax=Ruania alba TaxID=648782 RepID=A0A1H5B3U1_9MICO|nr:DUF6221 family protein [Ruania alba]SED49212.1 hypothetical protein SAMN04488554_0003 [Ruania alba]SEE60556.1 hypothetical protein SAMN04488554_2118 [Ruania alba]SEE60965.1 hypothetical protein SAMN04488554_2136 [Ruania alba]